jgi:acyl-CoA thioester hydrolase
MPLVSQQRVRYAETDQMGVVYYANYLVWFELGRVELLRSLGFDYRNLEAQHSCILPVVEATCRYRAPARYDDIIHIYAEPTLLRGSVLKFGYRIERATEDSNQPPVLLAEGETVHVVCTPDMQKCPLPEKYAAAIRSTMPSKQGTKEASSSTQDLSS